MCAYEVINRTFYKEGALVEPVFIEFLLHVRHSLAAEDLTVSTKESNGAYLVGAIQTGGHCYYNLMLIFQETQCTDCCSQNKSGIRIRKIINLHLNSST